MKIETHLLNELHAFRYTVKDPKYALVISHGLGGHGGIYDIFCEHHSAKGADIWSYDAPGHGRSTTNRPRGQWTMDEWAQASRDWATHVRNETGLPVFTLGSSLGVAAAISARDAAAVTGVICMGSLAVPGSPLLKEPSAPWRSDDVKAVIAQLGRGAALNIGSFFNFDKDYGYTGAQEQKKLDPYNTWSYDLASWASLFQYDPPEPLDQNTKPILYTAGGKDELAPEAAVQAMATMIGGPVRVEIFPDAGHQLMLFETEKFSKTVHEFCLANI
ncbi:alpha/beta hydrolase [Henriciella marina]|uniref:Alpha/beta hydrolase n=1 Tax=Henriciella marina TaxID=453851 RepID=A0ABT4LQ30_9PROT|nr:alpha/beta hydrolase [Henriciella marina]MCZ4296443.1 alpha/beta hydrolase [Henriciella marina]